MTAAGFNPHYLSDALSALDAPVVQFSFTQPGKPCLLTGLNELDGEPLDIHHHGRQVTVGDRELELDIPPAPVVPPVHQPLHAAPRRRDRPTSD